MKTSEKVRNLRHFFAVDDLKQTIISDAADEAAKLEEKLAHRHNVHSLALTDERNIICTDLKCSFRLSWRQAAAMLNEHATLKAKLEAIECAECGLTMRECKCDA